MKRFLTLTCLVCIPAILLGMTAVTFAAGDAGSNAAFARLKAEQPLVAKYEKGEYITRVYGRAFGSGVSPEDAAARFKNNYADLFNAEPEDLIPVSYLPDGRKTLPLMYDRETGLYRFTLVYYSQNRDNIPVFRSDLRLLVLNQADYPLVMASSGLRDLGDFHVPAGVNIDPILAQTAAKSFYPELINFNEPRLVIWAGIEDMVVNTASAMEIIADNGKPATDDFERWLFLVDTQTGEILYTEDMISNVDITGTVSGMATDGVGADICGEESAYTLPYARVFVDGGNTAFADENGDFTISHPGNTPVDVHSELRGQWFRVNNVFGSEAELIEEVTPPGPVNFMHNESNDNQYYRAEVNGYLQANVVRDFTLNYHPQYPVIHQQQNFAVNVNLNDNCNAFYDGYSINFYTSGGGCSNTAFSTVVHHEYGHHLVNVGGSGQGAYGEGMGDVMGILITDTPQLGFGFFNNCNQFMRTGDNNFQYPCSGEIHYCGQLISGCVWSTRNALIENYPDTYQDIISSLAINTMPLHNGPDIDPSITLDYLTVDDTDGDIWNGTPHAMEIIQGFVFDHNMDFGITPQIDHEPLIDNEDSNATLAVTADIFTFFSMEGGSAIIYYSFGGDFESTDMVNTSENTWEGEIPRPDYGTTIEYYIEATDDAGISNTSPEGAPESVHTFFFGADVIPPAMERLEFPPNTVNLFGPYGPFVISVWDIHGIDESNIKIHFRVNDESENELNLSPTGAENEFSLTLLDLDRQLNSGDIVNYYFTAYDEAYDPNVGRIPESGDYELIMANFEVFEDFEEFGIDRWFIEGSWSWREPGRNGGHSLTFGPNYPDNVDDMAYMEFGYDLSPYTDARISLYRRTAIIGSDSCFVLASNDGGDSWQTVGVITNFIGNPFYYEEFDISSIMDPDQHDYRVGFRFVSDNNTSAGVLMLDDIGWAIGPMTDIDEGIVEIPVEFALNQNYPNPFNPETNISFDLPTRSTATLDIFDIMGRKVITLVDGELEAGSYTVTWNGRDQSGNKASSGIYFYRLATGFGVRQAKMTLLK